MTGDEEKFWSICTTNSYIPTSPPPSASSTSPASREVSLYSQISLINHSCIPNAMWSWVSGDVRRSQVRALRDIQKDEEILGSYYDTTEFNYGSRQFRRQKLLENALSAHSRGRRRRGRDKRSGTWRLRVSTWRGAWNSMILGS